jgi:hypothetical protein
VTDSDEERIRLLERLIDYELPIEPVLEGLARFGWDSAAELVCLRRADVLAILDRYLRGELTAEHVTDWADQLELRDDVGMEPGYEDALRDAIFRLANPNLRDEITPAVARAIRGTLAPD